MSVVMLIKKFLRKQGFDIVTYHSFWDDIAAPMGIRTIFDIGANEGYFSAHMRKCFPKAMIYAFEPLHDCFETLNQKMPSDTHFHSFNVALGEERRDAVINRSSSHPSSSLLPMAGLHKKLYPGSAEHSAETIQVERLDDIMNNVPFEAPALVKIDVQGFEASVIRGALKTLKGCKIVVVENSFVTLYEGQALFAEIHDLLHGLGYSYRGRSETHYDPATKEPIYEDSVFIKE
jgi:FkbM family methyltransferase